MGSGGQGGCDGISARPHSCPQKRRESEPHLCPEGYGTKAGASMAASLGLVVLDSQPPEPQARVSGHFVTAAYAD